jgi:hypothetical protein
MRWSDGMKARHLPRLHFLAAGLAPVAFDQNPSTATMFPTVLDPACILMGWALIVAGGPCVVVAIVAVVPALPDVSPFRWWAWALVNGSRWSNTNHHLRK